MQAFFDCLDLMEGANKPDRRAHVEALIRNSTDADKLARQLDWLCGTPFSLRMKPADIDATLAPHLDPALLAIGENYAGDRLESLALQWETAMPPQNNDPLITALAPLSPTARYWLLRMVAGRTIPQLTPRDVIFALSTVYGIAAPVIAGNWFEMPLAQIIIRLEAETALPAPSPLGFRTVPPVADGHWMEGIEQANIQGVKVILSEGRAWTARGEALTPFMQLPEGMAVEAIVQLAGRNPNSQVRRALKRKAGLAEPFRVVITDILALRGKDVTHRPTVERCAVLDQLDLPESCTSITRLSVDRTKGSIMKRPNAGYNTGLDHWLRLPPLGKQLAVALLTWQALPTGLKLSVGCTMDDGTLAPIGEVVVTDPDDVAAIKALPVAGKYGPVRQIEASAAHAHIKASDIIPNPRKKSGFMLRDEEWVGLCEDRAISLQKISEILT